MRAKPDPKATTFNLLLTSVMFLKQKRQMTAVFFINTRQAA